MVDDINKIESDLKETCRLRVFVNSYKTLMHLVCKQIVCGP